ncbi:MAG: hypothetical protein Q8P13_01660 [bacterium]|nr:hypothetical protein [bacterium]
MKPTKKFEKGWGLFHSRRPESTFTFPHMSVLDLVAMIGALTLFAAVATSLVLAGFLSPREAVAGGALGALLILLFPHF